MRKHQLSWASSSFLHVSRGSSEGAPLSPLLPRCHTAGASGPEVTVAALPMRSSPTARLPILDGCPETHRGVPRGSSGGATAGTLPDTYRGLGHWTNRLALPRVVEPP